MARGILWRWCTSVHRHHVLGHVPIMSTKVTLTFGDTREAMDFVRAARRARPEDPDQQSIRYRHPMAESYSFTYSVLDVEVS